MAGADRSKEIDPATIGESHAGRVVGSKLWDVDETLGAKSKGPASRHQSRVK